MDRSEILSNRSSFEARYVPDFSELAMLVEHYRGVGLKVALVSGSFDMIHRGHMRYLEKAKAHGDILIVGVESDEKIRDRKKRYQLEGPVLVIRTGDMRRNGGSIAHLHAHLVEGDIDAAEHEPVRLKVSSVPKDWNALPEWAE